MPRYVTRVYDPTPIQVTAMRALLPPAVQEVVRHLSMHGAASINDLAAVFGVSGEAIRERVGVAEAAGLVAASAPPGLRRGRKTITYQVVPERVDELLDALGDYLHGR